MAKVATFAQRLKELLTVKNISQAELSRRSGVSKSSLTHYIKGDWEGKQDAVYAISNAMGIQYAWLMGHDVPMEGGVSPIDGANVLPMVEMRAWPVIGATACGDPVHREIYDQEIFAPADIHADAVFRCDGDSMIGARIYDGDLVFVAFDRPVDNGGIYLVQVEDEYTLKRVYMGNQEIRLVSENPKEPTRIYSGPDAERVKVIGKAMYFMGPVV